MAHAKTVCVLLAALALESGCQPNKLDAVRADAPTVSMSCPFTTQPWPAGGGLGKLLSSARYDVYTTSRSQEVLSHLPGFLEAAHDNYLRITGLEERSLPRRLAVYMMGSRNEWLDLTRSRMGARAGLFEAIQAGGYCYDGVGVYWDSGGLGGWSVAAHEGLHQFCHVRLRDRLPAWLEEGLATLAEGFQAGKGAVRFTPEGNSARFGDLRNAILQGWWIPLPKLLEMDGGEAIRAGKGLNDRTVGYYGQVWALARMLRTEGDLPQRRARMLADAQAGRFVATLATGPSAAQAHGADIALFRTYIDQDADGFDKRLQAYARRLVKLE
jgi:hypothetical protein